MYKNISMQLLLYCIRSKAHLSPPSPCLMVESNEKSIWTPKSQLLTGCNFGSFEIYKIAI